MNPKKRSARGQRAAKYSTLPHVDASSRPPREDRQVTLWDVLGRAHASAPPTWMPPPRARARASAPLERDDHELLERLERELVRVPVAELERELVRAPAELEAELEQDGGES